MWPTAPTKPLAKENGSYIQENNTALLKELTVWRNGAVSFMEVVLFGP